MEVPDGFRAVGDADAHARELAVEAVEDEHAAEGLTQHADDHTGHQDGQEEDHDGGVIGFRGRGVIGIVLVPDDQEANESGDADTEHDAKEDEQIGEEVHDVEDAKVLKYYGERSLGRVDVGLPRHGHHDHRVVVQSLQHVLDARQAAPHQAQAARNDRIAIRSLIAGCILHQTFQYVDNGDYEGPECEGSEVVAVEPEDTFGVVVFIQAIVPVGAGRGYQVGEDVVEEFTHEDEDNDPKGHKDNFLGQISLSVVVRISISVEVIGYSLFGVDGIGDCQKGDQPVYKEEESPEEGVERSHIDRRFLANELAGNLHEQDSHTNTLLEAAEHAGGDQKSNSKDNDHPPVSVDGSNDDECNNSKIKEDNKSVDHALGEFLDEEQENDGHDEGEDEHADDDAVVFAESLSEVGHALVLHISDGKYVVEFLAVVDHDGADDEGGQHHEDEGDEAADVIAGAVLVVDWASPDVAGVGLEVVVQFCGVSVLEHNHDTSN